MYNTTNMNTPHCSQINRNHSYMCQELQQKYLVNNKIESCMHGFKLASPLSLACCMYLQDLSTVEFHAHIGGTFIGSSSPCMGMVLYMLRSSRIHLTSLTCQDLPDFSYIIYIYIIYTASNQNLGIGKAGYEAIDFRYMYI